MSFLDKVRRENRRRREQTKADTVEVGGQSVSVGDSETAIQVEDSILTSTRYGIPRGRDALEAENLAETQPFEIAKNVIVDQLLGGDLVFPSDEEDVDESVEDLKGLFRDLLQGPHLLGYDLDDLMSAAVSDMVGPGNAYWEAIPSADGKLPVAALKPVPALSVQLNITPQGEFKEPAYYQFPFRGAGGDQTSIRGAEVNELSREQLVSMHWPGSVRSDDVYPMSPAMQVKQYLQILTNMSVHANRFFSDNEVPPGILHVPGVSEDNIQDIQSQLRDARGDPRKVPVINPDTDAKWIEVGGTGLNLDIIEGEKWYTQMVWGALGIPKSELGIIEDVNRSNGQEQAAVIYKRVTKNVTKTITQALKRQVLKQFDAYRDLGEPFGVGFQHSDPVRELQEQQAVRDQWQEGLLTWAEARHKLGDEPPEDTVVSINGEDIDWAALPKNISKRVFQAASSGDTIELDADLEAGD